MSLARVGWNLFVIDRSNCQSEASYLFQLEVEPLECRSQLGSDTGRTEGTREKNQGWDGGRCGSHATNATKRETESR